MPSTRANTYAYHWYRYHEHLSTTEMGYMTHHHCKQRRFLEIRYVVLCLKLEISQAVSSKSTKCRLSSFLSIKRITQHYFSALTVLGSTSFQCIWHDRRGLREDIEKDDGRALKPSRKEVMGGWIWSKTSERTYWQVIWVAISKGWDASEALPRVIFDDVFQDRNRFDQKNSRL